MATKSQLRDLHTGRAPAAPKGTQAQGITVKAPKLPKGSALPVMMPTVRRPAR